MSEPPAPIAPAPARSERYPVGPWLGAAAAACGCVVVALVDPTEHMVTPPCPLRSTTGWWCPFCGATRAASRVLRGDLVSAFRYNAMFLVLLPIVAALWAGFAFPGRFRWLDPVRARSRPIVVVLAVVLGAFMVVRNTPLGDSWLRYPGS